MSTRTFVSALLLAALVALTARESVAKPLTVASDFEGASVRVLDINQDARSIAFMPGGDPSRGWPCWWYFRIEGIAPGETVTLRLQGSIAAIGNRKPLSASWAMPARATWSDDGEIWHQTDKGERDGDWMVYTVRAKGESVYVAWGPPFTPATARTLVDRLSEASPHATAEELCRSRDGRSVPMLCVSEGDRPSSQRFGVWVQARQHAWESGSSWVARGFAEWLLSDDPQATWLRQHAEISIVPVMDVDNTASGNGGKNALPHDHNRDWSDQPHWNEVAAAQENVRSLIEQGRMDVFLDLHNPAPGDPTFFYVLPRELLREQAADLRDRFIELAYGEISSIRPMVPMSNTPKVTGPRYHPLWKQISSNWVAMNGNPHTVSLCLETIWNSQRSTPAGYRGVGAALAAAVSRFLAEQPAR
ncbi:Zinc carboxypeptidase [Maioricimonas rarisocia]|uniref:Zinc carboxypeptidase n=1 Tax=Maioricimonas rarisocia TaxID=2528026 RepID=A0A517Z7U7_9PLAN|nr:M14-type cytosolic carboxypeptidase [Maioricimonas rarisocia]QDU38511.1 Zinc carboxypeptidase [Maioricimonas rarisocia]